MWKVQDCFFAPYFLFNLILSCLFLVVDVHLPFSTCLFHMVDVNHVKSAGLFLTIKDMSRLIILSCLFLVVDVDLPFSNWSTIDIRRRPSTSILQPFSSRPMTIGIMWKYLGNLSIFTYPAGWLGSLERQTLSFSRLLASANGRSNPAWGCLYGR